MVAIYGAVAILVAFSGLFSGLNLGLLSLSIDELERKKSLGNKEALAVYPVRKKGNLLLCTLLLSNVAVNAAISILLSDVASGLIAGIVSTALIVVFGEIIPQALVSRYALLIGAKIIWITKLFIFGLYPLAAPMAFLLDHILGDELPTVWSKAELQEIIKEHENSPHSELDRDEERIVIGALSFSEKTVRSVMTPQKAVYSLNVETLLDDTKLKEIRETGFTRIPVYLEYPGQMVGILYAKDLIGIPLNMYVKQLYKHNHQLRVGFEDSLDGVLNVFIKKRRHLAFVYDEFDNWLGIITLEDIVEEILQREVFDEEDDGKDPRQEIKKIIFDRS